MRIALLQLRIQDTGRSANLTHVLRQVVRAAEAIPAPDLLVLPGCCDGTSREGVTGAMAQGFGESLAAAAREWGLFVAAGMLGVHDGAVREEACLYDPDGDAIAWSGGGSQTPGDTVFDTPLGAVWIGTETDEEPFCEPADPCDLLLLLGRWTASAGQARQACQRLRKRLGQVARRTGAVACGVGAVGNARNRGGADLIGVSALCGPDGRCVVAAQPGVEEAVIGELTTPVAKSSDRPVRENQG